MQSKHSCIPCVNQSDISVDCCGKLFGQHKPQCSFRISSSPSRAILFLLCIPVIMYCSIGSHEI